MDTEAKKRQGIFGSCRKDFGSDRFLNIITFKTEGSKSACLTACRGLGMNSDDAQFLADMIPFERGANWPLHDCFYGNEEAERQPLTQFIKEIEKYENLKDIMLSIEGLIVGRSIHASGSYIFDKGYIEQNALMKAPNGSYVTQWNMKDSDWCGGLKVDLLTIEALDKIRTCLELLLKHGKIEWQGTWRNTYDKYIHPDVIDYDSPEMWEMIADNQVDSLFQFVTTIGVQTAKEVKPTTLTQLADANSLMRLMADESGVSPVEIYVRYKKDINEWYEELKYYNLTLTEIKILEKHLLKVFGVSSTQEEIMILAMDKNVSNFSLAEANGLRKAIAKKNKKALETTKELFFRKGLECGSRQQLLDYVWNVQIKRQLGYSFSKNHTYPYSNIAIQELNLAYHHNSLFWNCSCLTIDSGGSVEEFEYESSNSETIVVEDDEDINGIDSHEKTTNYGKLASAIGKMQDRNVKIALPDINRSQLSFFPDEVENEIIFGLKGVVGISDDVSNDIITNRPFTNLEDFYNRMTLAKKDVIDGSGKAKKVSLVSAGKLISLIKGGAFDKVENKSRHEIMRNFIALTSPDKKSMTLANVDAIVAMGIVPEHLNTPLRIHKFKSFVTDKNRVAKDDEKTKSKKWFRIKGGNDSITSMANVFFEEHFISSLTEDKDYYYDEDGYVCVLSGASSCEFDKVVAQKTAEFKQWINSPDCLDRFNEQTFQDKWGNLLKETTSQWEMDSLSFYYGEHELAHVDLEHYGISNFFELPEIPVETGEFSKYKDRLYPKFELTRICGTVLDKNKYKHTVSLLTPHGVMLVKFQSGAFSHYDKTISMVDSEGSKTRVENGWFSRGNKLLLTGFRRGEQFVPKKYKNSIQQHTVCLVEEITEEGKLILKTERSRV